MATYSTIAGGFRYGFGVMYALQVEGFQWLWTERDVGATDPVGYTQDASLAIDDSSRIGSLIDRRRGIGKAFDLSVKLLDSTVNAAIFKKPSVAARLTSALVFGETGTITVDSNTSFASSGIVFIGQEAIGYASKNGSTELKTLTRGAPGGDWKAYTHATTSQISSWVTDKNLFFRGKRVKLYAIPITPHGKVTGANALAAAAVVWHGTIYDEPVRVDDGWSFSCRSFDRLLESPAITPYTGTGAFDLYDDKPIEIDKSWTWGLSIYYQPGNYSLLKTELKPFDYAWINDGDVVSQSWAREQIAYNFNSQSFDLVQNMTWKAAVSSTGTLGWTLYIECTCEPTFGARPLEIRRWNVTGTGPLFFSPTSETDWFTTPDDLPEHPAYGWASLQMVMFGYSGMMAYSPGIRAKFPPEQVVDIPATGWLLVESDGESFFFLYTSKTVQGDEVLFTTSADVHADQVPFPFITDQAIKTTFTVTTCSLLDGEVVDAMRHILMSSGRGDNDATFDTLPQQSGYDLAQVETASFDTVLDGGWVGLEASLMLKEDKSFADLFGGLLALSQRAIVPRSDGTTIKLAAVRMNVAEVGAVAVTITDADLVISPSGKRPIRPKRPKNPPNKISLDALDKMGEKAGSVLLQDLISQRAAGTSQFKIETYGIDVEDLVDPATSWARTLFGDLPAPPIIEIDVAPWVDVETGDAVDLSLTHFALWDSSAGTRGYSGAARVLGRQINLKTQVQTITVMTQGTYRKTSLAPAAPVVSFAGGGGSPSSINLALSYLDLFEAYEASSAPFTVTAYKPGQDGVSYGYTISAVAQLGGGCRLTVASVVGTFTLTTDWFITLPVTGSSNAAQKKHMHDADGSKWL